MERKCIICKWDGGGPYIKEPIGYLCKECWDGLFNVLPVAFRMGKDIFFYTPKTIAYGVIPEDLRG